jgi:hypothetical protein
MKHFARGDNEAGNWTAVDSQGRNATVSHHEHKGSMRSDAWRGYDIAVWDLDRYTYAVMVSLFDKINTTQAIKTLAVS